LLPLQLLRRACHIRVVFSVFVYSAFLYRSLLADDLFAFVRRQLPPLLLLLLFCPFPHRMWPSSSPSHDCSRSVSTDGGVALSARLLLHVAALCFEQWPK